MVSTFYTPSSITPEQANPMQALITRALKTFTQGTQAAYLPQQLQADLQQKQAASQKNIVMAQLLKSLMGGGDGENQPANNSGIQSSQGESSSIGNNSRAALLKGLLHIDPYLMSPQETQNLKIKGDLQTQANKNNLTTGSSDVSREFLQDKVSMPEQYMGALGSGSMAKDMVSAKLGDKEAQERLIQAAVAEKLVPEYSGFQLMSQGQKATVSALKHQQEAIRQGWPKLSGTITNNLPPKLQKEAEKRHNQIVKQVNKNREAFFNTGGKERPEFNRESNSLSNSISWSDIQHTAQKRGMSENDVIDKLAKKNGLSVDEFMKNVQMENQ